MREKNKLEKNKLDILELNQLTTDSSLRRLLTIGTKGIQGASEGLGVGSIIMVVLSLAAGISVSGPATAIMLGVPIVLFGGLSIILSSYQLWKGTNQLDQLKNSYDSELKQLKKSLMLFFKNYALTQDWIKNLDDKRDKLDKMEIDTYDDQEKEAINKKKAELEEDIKSLREDQSKLFLELKVILNLLAGKSDSEKLATLFNYGKPEINGEDLFNRFDSVLVTEESDLTLSERAVDLIKVKLNSPLPQSNKVNQIQTKINDDIASVKEKEHIAIKRLSLISTGLGGFIGGVGAALTICAIYFGGFAVLGAIGWPVLIPIIVVGVVSSIVQLAYTQKIEKAQRRVGELLASAVKKTSGIANYLDASGNQLIEKLNAIETKQEESQSSISIRLNEHQKSYQDYKKTVTELCKKIKKIGKQGHELKFFSTSMVENIQEIENAFKENKTLLTVLRSKVAGIAIISGSEQPKSELLKYIDGQLETTQNYLTDINLFNSRKLGIKKVGSNNQSISDEPIEDNVFKKLGN